MEAMPTLDDFKKLRSDQQQTLVERFANQHTASGNKLGHEFRRQVARGQAVLLSDEEALRKLFQQIQQHQAESDHWQKLAAWVRDSAYHPYFGGPNSSFTALSEQVKLISNMDADRLEAGRLSGSGTDLQRWLDDWKAFRLAMRSFHFAILSFAISAGWGLALAVLPYRAIVNWYTGGAAIWGVATGLTLGAYFWRYPAR